MCVQLAGLSRDFDVKKHFVDSILSNKVGFNFEERSINPWIERPSVGSSSLRSLSAPSRSMKPGLVWHILAHTDDISIPFKRGSTQLSIWTHFNIGRGESQNDVITRIRYHLPKHVFTPDNEFVIQKAHKSLENERKKQSFASKKLGPVNFSLTK